MGALPRGIGAKLFLAFSATALPVLLAAGLLLEWQARRALEMELGRRVEALAVAISTSIPGETWKFAFAMGRGEEESRTVRRLRERLDAVRDATGAERIAVWDLRGNLIVESQSTLPIGTPAPRAPLLEAELARVRAGATASTPLYRAAGGRRMKIGLAPIVPAREAGAPEPGSGGDGPPVGALIVEAPSLTLGVVHGMRGTLAATGAVALLLVVGAALLLSGALGGRIRRLARVARRIEAGDLAPAIPAGGEDEIGELAGALEAMRGAVQIREEELRAMLGGVAHEIRNPLGGLLLHAEMLTQDQDLTGEQAGRARRIVAEAARLEKVVGDFLAFARPERPQGERVRLGEVFSESAENARAALGWEGVLETDLGAGEAWCDGGHLRQILLNLMRNAMQAAGPEGCVRVGSSAESEGGEAQGEREEWILPRRASAPRRPGEGGRARAGEIAILVEDSGNGVAEAERARIFEAFYTTRSQGAGLGLAVVKRLCQLNGMGIAVGRSRLGGARFHLCVPAATED